jgi:hypothetical protein
MMRDEYFGNGYVVRRGLLPANLIAELNQRFADARCEDIWGGHKHTLDKYCPRDD